ncbi:MAG: glycosyltransferase family 4 protein [Pirellulales bacterium]
MPDPAISPAQVAMLVQGSEVYGIGTIEKLYAESWPEMTFICLGPGPMFDWLRGRGARVELVEGLVSLREKSSLATLCKMPLVFQRAKRDAQRIDALVRGRGVRVIHAQWRPQQIIAGYMRRLSYRSVWQINNNMSRQRLAGLGVKLNHRLARWGADLLLPASDFIAANWEGCGVPIRTIRNAAVPLFAEPNEVPLKGPLRTLTAGRLEASKGHHVAVDAVIAARQVGCDATLDMYGGPVDGNPYADELKRKIEAAGVGAAIQFMGFRDDLRTRQREYHLGLQCRLDPEPCSLWVCETLVDGLPLLASATGGTPELVEEGVTGLLYPPGAADVLARQLVELGRDRRRLAAMRPAAFERGRRQFTVERFLRETLAAYESLDRAN